MQPAVTPLVIAAVLLLPAFIAAFPQAPFDPFESFPAWVMGGRIQQMVATDRYLVVHRVESQGQHVVELWTEPDMRTLWQKHFVSVGDRIVVDGDRVAFEAAESLPASRSVGRYVFNALTGARVSYSRGSLIGRAGRFIVDSGDSIVDMADGSTVFGHVSDVRHVRFLASVGQRCLLLVSTSGDWNDRRPVLYDPATKTDLWSGRPIAPAVREFLDTRVNSATRLAFDGFPLLIAENGQAKAEPAFRFLLLREDGTGAILDRAFFGLQELAPEATIDFAYAPPYQGGRLLVAGINTGHLGRVDGKKEIVAVFDASGRKLAQSVIDLTDNIMAWSSLSPAGNLLMFLNELRPRHRDLIVTYTVPMLGRSDVECAYDAQVNSPPGLVGSDLFLWARIRRVPGGTPGAASARTQIPVVVSVDPRTAGVTSYYTFDNARWKLMDYDKDRIRHVGNASHLFLPFQPAGGPHDSTLLLIVPRSVKGWLDASLRVAPEPIYTDSEAKVTYGPASATVTVNTGRLNGTTWRTSSVPGTAVFTVAIGSVTQAFPVEVRARPANLPPFPTFVLVDSSTLGPWSPEASFNAQRSFDPDGRIVSYTWDFGDQTPATPSPYSFGRHTYAIPGEYVVALTVTDDKGLTARSEKRVVVNRILSPDGEQRGIPAALAGGRKVGYDIEFTTGDAEGAGTNAAVHLAMYGPPNADQERVGTGEIDPYDTIDEAYGDAFERGHTDVFKSHQGKAKGLGDYTHLDDVDFITVRHDNTGARPDWLVQSIRIRNQSSQKEWFFEPETWLAFDRAPLRNVMAVFKPSGGSYPRGVLFGGSQRAWDITEAGGDVFILKTTAGKFYFTAQDRALSLEVWLNGVVVGRQYARGSGLATPPYIPKPEWGVEYDIGSLTRPTQFTIRLSSAGATWSESSVWVFPASWANYQAEALAATVLQPLRGQTSYFSYGDSVRQAMKSAASWNNIMTAALAPVLAFGTQSMALFGAPSNVDLSGTLEERVGLHVANGLGKAVKALGMTLAGSVVGETVGLFEAMIKARQYGRQIGTVTSEGAAAAGGLDLLGRMADCNPNLVQVTSMLNVVKGKVETLFGQLEANDPAGYRRTFDDIRRIAVGLHPQSADPADYRIDYRAYGISDMTPGATSDNYCLSMLCLLELNNIQSWKSGGIAPCFPSNPIYPISTDVKRRDSAAAMVSYETLWKDIMAVAGVVVDIALLRQ
ncbi:MAG: PKD domain-containing protein [Acidobacteria bacterium]|nr:PKD domain-containing protein [Acidobacteriota bacterium]